MKLRVLSLFGVLATAGLLMSCNGGGSADLDPNRPYFDQATLPNDIKGMVEQDLKEYGLDLVVLIPDSTKGYAAISEMSYGETEIKVGRGYHIRIAEGADIDLKRTDIQEDLLFETEVLLDEDTCLVYKSTIRDDPQHVEHHFYLVRTIDGIDYEISDVEGAMHSERAVRAMLEAGKFIVKRRPDPPKPEA